MSLRYRVQYLHFVKILRFHWIFNKNFHQPSYDVFWSIPWYLEWLIKQWERLTKGFMGQLTPITNLKFWTSERLRDWQRVTNGLIGQLTLTINLKYWDWQRVRTWETDRCVEGEGLRDWQRVRTWETDRGWDSEELRQNLTESERQREADKKISIS
jgi:hypothetical protein